MHRICIKSSPRMPWLPTGPTHTPGTGTGFQVKEKPDLHALSLLVPKFPYGWIAQITIDILWKWKRLPEAVGWGFSRGWIGLAALLSWAEACMEGQWSSLRGEQELRRG